MFTLTGFFKSKGSYKGSYYNPAKPLTGLNVIADVISVGGISALAYELKSLGYFRGYDDSYNTKVKEIKSDFQNSLSNYVGRMGEIIKHADKGDSSTVKSLIDGQFAEVHSVPFLHYFSTSSLTQLHNTKNTDAKSYQTSIAVFDISQSALEETVKKNNHANTISAFDQKTMTEDLNKLYGDLVYPKTKMVCKETRADGKCINPQSVKVNPEYKKFSQLPNLIEELRAISKADERIKELVQETVEKIGIGYEKFTCYDTAISHYLATTQSDKDFQTLEDDFSICFYQHQDNVAVEVSTSSNVDSVGGELV